LTKLRQFLFAADVGDIGPHLPRKAGL
jgi:hypothetical protein